MESTAFITARQERDAIGTRMISRRYQGGNPIQLHPAQTTWKDVYILDSKK